MTDLIKGYRFSRLSVISIDGNEIEEFYEAELNRVLAFPRTLRYISILTLCSGIQINRLGGHSKVKFLPLELVKKIAGCFKPMSLTIKDDFHKEGGSDDMEQGKKSYAKKLPSDYDGFSIPPLLSPTL